MSDDRLFVSNNAIGRKWYFLNILILILIYFLTDYAFDNLLFLHPKSNSHLMIGKGILWFLNVIYMITFLALVDRRLFDTIGSRGKRAYRELSSFLLFIVLFHIASIILDYNILDLFAFIFDGIFLLITFVLFFTKGKISNLTYEEYKEKIKYE